MRFLYTEHHHEDDDAVEISTSSFFLFCFVFSLCCMTGLLYILLKKYNNRVVVETTDNVIVIMEDAPKELKEHIYDETTQYIPEICTICISEFTLDEKLTTLECDHTYHHACITEWYQKNQACPICK
jgi:hypothetical protein